MSDTGDIKARLRARPTLEDKLREAYEEWREGYIESSDVLKALSAYLDGNGTRADLFEIVDAERTARTTAEARLSEALAREKVLAAELRKLMLAYVGTLETGRDRILFLGGTCDPVDIMEAGDPALRRARAVLSEQTERQG